VTTLMPRLIMNGAIPPLSHTSSKFADTGKNLPFSLKSVTKFNFFLEIFIHVINKIVLFPYKQEKYLYV
jgi:hypothetical protein